jgi:membrane protein implicated in regulation of membrane protease activity
MSAHSDAAAKLRQDADKYRRKARRLEIIGSVIRAFGILLFVLSVLSMAWYWVYDISNITSSLIALVSAAMLWANSRDLRVETPRQYRASADILEKTAQVEEMLHKHFGQREEEQS